MMKSRSKKQFEVERVEGGSSKTSPSGHNQKDKQSRINHAAPITIILASQHYLCIESVFPQHRFFFPHRLRPVYLPVIPLALSGHSAAVGSKPDSPRT
jgi:hypothetical protein